MAGIAAVTVVALPFLLTAPGCGLQGEGQRCDRSVSATPSDLTTGNDDCDTSAGLVCVSKDVLSGVNSDICCPANNGASQNPNCQRGSGSGNGTGGAAPTTAVTSAATTTTSAGSTSSTATAGSSSSASSSSSSASSSSSTSGSSSSTGP